MALDSLKESNKTLSDDPLNDENSPDKKKVQETDQEDVKVATTNGEIGQLHKIAILQ